MLKLSRRLWLILFLIFSFTFLLSGQLIAVPSVKLNSLTGSEVSLDDYKGKQPLVLFFWTTWCPYCREEIKQLNLMEAQLKQKGISVFAVDVGEPGYKVARFFQDFPVNFQVLLDKEGLLASDQGIAGVPTYILFNKSGKEVSRGYALPKDFERLMK